MTNSFTLCWCVYTTDKNQNL